MQALLDADAAFDPRTAGYLPRMTYDHADALGQQLQPLLQDTLTALSDRTYVPAIRLPLVFGPRIENGGRPCPVTHLEGFIAAARELHDWAAGLRAHYERADTQATAPLPAEISAHLALVPTRLAQAESQLRFGTDFAG